MRKNISSILWGTLFIVAGVGFIGNAFGFWNFHLFFHGWWTLLIIIPSAVSIFQNGPKPFAISTFIIGVLLLLACQGCFDYEVIEKLILPIIFIVTGISLILKNCGIRFSKEPLITEYDDRKEYAATFSSLTVVLNENDVFKGASLNAIVGGIELDLRACIINEDVVIDCTSVFGGMDVFVPKDVNVKISSTPIFGGVSNKKRGPLFIPGVPTVYINAVCMFGGVDIK